eukprot:1991741-Pleurochrysis_carterae.AAC.1
MAKRPSRTHGWRNALLARTDDRTGAACARMAEGRLAHTYMRTYPPTPRDSSPPPYHLPSLLHDASAAPSPLQGG